MSFLFNWTDLQKIDFKSIINDALSQFNIPQFPNKLQLKSLNINHEPPELKILKIQEFSIDKLQLQIEFKYHGELELNLNSKLEINSINLIEFDSFTKPHFVMANKSTVIPIDFKIYNFNIDSIMTFIFIKKINKLILIFNEDPIIEFNIESSIDELLDDEIILEIKNDTLGMCLSFIKHDLPLIINGYSIIEGMDTINEIEIEDNTKTIKSIIESNDSRSKVFNNFETLSLCPSAFDNIFERINLKDIEPQETVLPVSKKSIKKKRIIKMKKKSKLSNSPSIDSISLSPLPLNDSLINSPTLIDTSLDLNSIDELLNTPTPPRSSTPEYLSSPNETLQYEDTFHNDTFDQTFDDSYNPYENILHPLDIPAFQELTNSLKEKENEDSSTSTSCIFEYDSNENLSDKKLSMRRTSSNYINLNEFKSTNK